MKKFFGVLTALLLMLVIVPASPAAAADGTPVNGEPACLELLWLENCFARNIYRTIHNSTGGDEVDEDAVPGEPACRGMLWWLNCNGRDIYREVYVSTMTPTVENVRAAMLATYAPIMNNGFKSNALEAAVEENYNKITNPSRAKCYQTTLLEFIPEFTKVSKITAEAAEFANEAIGLFENVVPPGLVYQEGIGLLTDKYGELLDRARAVSLSESAYNLATGAFLDCEFR